MRRALPALMVVLAAGAAGALDLPLPEDAERTTQVTSAADTIHLPEGPAEDERVPRLRLDGAITSRAWRMPGRGQGTLARMTPLRAALEAGGWEVAFDCASEGCGGFGFRFATPVLPAPAMFVNIFDYRYLLARRGTGETAEHAMLFVSRAGERIYVQLTHVGPVEAGAPAAAADAAADAPAPEPREDPSGDLAAVLRREGHVVLSGLDFASGDAMLGPGPHSDLVALAAFLAATPRVRIVLVGHTDTVGALDGNIALSQARAEAVRARLIEAHGVEGARVEAHGVGYLAPLGPNDTPGGREANRRVEAVLLE